MDWRMPTISREYVRAASSSCSMARSTLRRPPPVRMMLAVMDEYDLICARPSGVKHSAGLTVMLLSSCSRMRSEEHTSELQSRENLVCRLLLEKKKKKKKELMYVMTT